MFKDKEIAKALIELEVANRENVLLLLPTIKEIVQDFNGKVLNKRLEKSLNNAIKGRSVYIPYSSISCDWGAYFRIDFRVGNRYVPNGKYSVSYINNSNLILCCCKQTEAMSVNDKGTKRLISSGVIADMERWDKTMRDYIVSHTEALKHIDEWNDKFGAIEKEINALRNQIPSDIRNYFGFNWYLTN